MIIGFITIVYFIIGIMLAYFWWICDYEEDYNKAKEDDEIEESMAVIFILLMIMFWPLKVVWDFFKTI